MSRIIGDLRQTPKGQLRYDRSIDGKSLKAILHKCTSAPALSFSHKEVSPAHPCSLSGVGLSLSLCEDDEHSKSKPATFSVNGHINNKEPSKQDQGGDEKGKLDSFEKEDSSINFDDVDDMHSVNNSKGRDSERSIARSPRLSPGNEQSPELKNEEIISKCGVSEDNLSLRDPCHGELTRSFAEKMRLVYDVEQAWDNQVKHFREHKGQQFVSHQSWLEEEQQQQIWLIEQRYQQDLAQQLFIVNRKQQSSSPAIPQAVQKVKANHEECSRRQDARLKEIERLCQQSVEEKARRKQALEQKLVEIKTMAQTVVAARNSLASKLDSCPHKQHLPDAAEKTRQLVRKLSEQAEAVAATVDLQNMEEVVKKLTSYQEQGQNALDFVTSLTTEAEQKSKAAASEAENQKQQQAAQQAQAQASGQAAGQGPPSAPAVAGQAAPSVQSAEAGEKLALEAVAKEYSNNVKLLSQVDAALQPFVSNQQMKKARFDLQRAVNMPVNAISPVNSAHLRDKLVRLRSLLNGEMVEIPGKHVSTQSVPQGVMFCKNLVAKMIARKADEQVSSNHDSAFAIAAVAVGLWAEFPDVGELLMAHLQALCPYVLPFYPPRQPQQSSTDYHRTLGYKVEEDGTIEQQDKFLRRMSGILRLYAAILVTAPPQGRNQPHPHGLAHAWIWLTRSLNLSPNPDITATAIYDMLQVTGHFLLKAYKVQFVKLIYNLYKVFLPKLKDVAAGSGPVCRLQTFLETTLRNNAIIAEPEGYLPPHFWNY